MKALALDLSKTRTGAACFVDGTPTHTYAQSFKQFKPSEAALLYDAFRRWLLFEARVGEYDVVYAEDAYHRNHKTARLLYGMEAHLMQVCLSVETPLVFVHWNSARAAVRSKSKADTLEAVQTLYPSLEVGTSDEADAVAIGLAGLRRCGPS